MPEALKHIYNEQFIHSFSGTVEKVVPGFSATVFHNQVFDSEWESKELKQRMRHIAASLGSQLHKDFKKSVHTILQLIKQLRKENVKEYGIEYMFFPDYIEQFGIDHPDLSLNAIEEITQFTSCEFAIRPFIKQYPDKSMKQMLIWSKHSSHLVRRFSSEGCRPRLPWAMALPDLKKNPLPLIPILENLKADPSEFVRRSVANNLNDIAKDHPDVVIHLVKKWKGKSKETDWVIRHGSRTLLKKADKEIYPLFGLSHKVSFEVSALKLQPATIPLGGQLQFSFHIKNTGRKATKARIEFAIYYVKSSGKQHRKLFRITENQYEPGTTYSFTKNISFHDLTTRKHYAGKHRICIIINGKELAGKNFLLK